MAIWLPPDIPIHPMHRPRRPIIVTGPINRMGDTFATALERGDKGVLVNGNGRDGKTWGVECLATHPAWQPFPVAFFFMDYGKPEKATENYFSATFLEAADMKTIRHATGAESMTRACNLLIEKTRELRQEVIAVVINEANRFTSVEHDHLVTLDNLLERRRKRVFYMLIHQNDAERGGQQSIDHRPPPQVTGRFYSMAHQFTGLLWGSANAIDFQDCDVAMALNEYDEGVIFPDDETGVSCTAYFARNAYANGYRLTSQVGLFREVVEDLRVKNHLLAAAPFPMQSFERFVYFLLVRIAGEDPNFRQFTREQALKALLWAGYIELELSKHAVVSDATHH
jgi:hypothetical protein